MYLPSSLSQAVTSSLGVAIREIHACTGGDINQAARLITQDDALFIKWHASSVPGMFSAEARGLELLRQTGVVRVPQVVAVAEATAACPAYLVLEWLPSGSANTHTDQELGEGLAALHRLEADSHGLDHDNFIGRLNQPNCQRTTWSEFFAQQRIQPQMEEARRSGQLPTHREQLLNRLLANLADLLPTDNPPASLLHGDLWRGNVMVLPESEPAVIDPAVYYGHREIELAFTELFGGFSARFYDAYNSSYPLDKSYRERRALYQLYPLMVHMNLFGGGYASRVDSILRQYVA